MDLYSELGIPRDASPEEIKAAHRRAVKKHHPDAGGDKAKFQKIQLAFDTLKDEARRRRYDETGDAFGPTPPDPAIEALGSILESMVTEMLGDGVSIETQDMRQILIKAVRDNISGVAQEQARYERQLKKAGQLMKRWKRKKRAKGPDLIGDTLRRQERDLKEHITRMKDAIKVWNRAMHLLDSYEYEVDEVPLGGAKPRSWPIGGFVTSTEFGDFRTK